jgi:hypothetical protein
MTTLTVGRNLAVENFPNNGVLLFPGAGDQRRCWPVTEYAALARWCIARGLPVIASGGAGDRLKTAAIARAAEGCLDAGGLFDWPAQAGLVSQSRLVVSNDSAALHLAVACGVAVVCISNGNHYGRFTEYPEGLLTAPACFVYPSSLASMSDPADSLAKSSKFDIGEIAVERVCAVLADLLGEDR